MDRIYKAMTIAGSDTSGGAGMEADLKTFQELGVYGMTALTCIVTMDPLTWTHNVTPIALDVVEKQIQTIVEGIGIKAMKTGMLGSAALVELVASSIDKYQLPNVVIDPVMVCKGSTDVMVPEAAEAIKELLVKRCDIITPNTVEAAYLTSMSKIDSVADIKEAAYRLHAMGAKHVVIKGGERITGGVAMDIFTDGETFNEMASTKLANAYNHGAGCTYSAAVTAGLANGLSMQAAVCQAKAFVTAALKHSFVLNNFSGATNHMAYKKYGVL